MTAATLEIIRLNIGDINADLYTFTDTMIENIYNAVGGNVNLTSAKFLRSLAVMAGQRSSVSMGKISESANAAELTKQAEAFEALAKADGVDLNGNAVAYDEVVEMGYTEFACTDIAKNINLRTYPNE